MTPQNRHRASSPCPHKSGSDERLRTMELRYELGLPLHMDGDNPELIPIQHDNHKPGEFFPKTYRDPQS